MEGLISFLIIAGLFYFMMRHGCGSHMTHGHSGHGHSDSNNAGDDSQAAKHIDPVCETEVKTEQGYGKMHKGILYRFCSKSCLDKFDADPERYLDKEQGESHGM